MIELVPVSADKAKTRCGRFGLIAMVVALHCVPAIAVELDDAITGNVASAPQAGISWLSGGVGDEAMTEMRKVSAAYNVQLMLTGPRGNYLASVPFKVSRPNGKPTVSGVTEGPLLYLKLPAGSYQIAVQTDGAWQSRRVQAASSGKATKVRFVAKGE